jgi:uncharacterized protein
VIDRRAFLKTGSAVAATFALGGVGDYGLHEASSPKVVRVQLQLPRLPEAWQGTTIAQLSDFHYDRHFTAVTIKRAVDIVNQLRPDLVMLTGDFVTLPIFFRHFHNGKQAARAAFPCADLLGQLSAPLGVFAVLGNHDVFSDPERISEILQARQIQVLRNTAIPLEREGQRLWLAGLDDVLAGNPDLDLALGKIPTQEPIILLVHEPDFVRKVARYAVDLQLSGHSHGGQIRFPWLGPAYLPPLGRKYPAGLYHLGPLTLYTNVGIGTLWVPARLNCPPEITLFILNRTRSDK